MTFHSWLYLAQIFSGGVSYFTDKIIYISNKNDTQYIFLTFRIFDVIFLPSLFVLTIILYYKIHKYVIKNLNYMREFYLNQREFYSFHSFFFSKTEQNIKRIKRRTKVDIGQKVQGGSTKSNVLWII